MKGLQIRGEAIIRITDAEEQAIFADDDVKMRGAL